MRNLAILASVALLFIILWDTFETIVLPRTVTRRFRLTRFFYRASWAVWSGVTRFVPDGIGDGLLGAYGPLSLLLLIGVWAICLIFAFALLHWGLGSHIVGVNAHHGFPTDFYLSGATFFTLGFGDVTPGTPIERAVAVIEAGVGFGFLAVVISYLPVLYQSFSKRESGISMLDSRAGSPPSAGELMARHGRARNMEMLTIFLADWEKWASELLESHLSYPVLIFYRSQHTGESWLSALTTILDTCALVNLGFTRDTPWENALRWQAHLTFAMARHAIVDLALVVGATPLQSEPNRLPAEAWERLRGYLDAAGLTLCNHPSARTDLDAARRMYEPYVAALAARLLLPLPAWLHDETVLDNWQTSAWDETPHF